MLTNLESLPLDRIHSMLRMFAMQDSSSSQCSVDDLRRFLDRKVKDQELQFVNGFYRLPKSGRWQGIITLYKKEQLLIKLTSGSLTAHPEWQVNHFHSDICYGKWAVLVTPLMLKTSSGGFALNVSVRGYNLKRAKKPSRTTNRL